MIEAYAQRSESNFARLAPIYGELRTMSAPLERILAEELEAHRPEYVLAVNSRIEAELPELFADDGRRELARASTEAGLTDFGTLLRLGLTEGFRAPAVALAYARHLADAGIPLAHILRSYRLGQEVIFERVAELARELGDQEAVARIGVLSFRIIDAITAEVAHEYDIQREALVRDSVTRRNRIVRDLLAGADVDVGAAERTLGYRLDGGGLLHARRYPQCDVGGLDDDERPSLS